MRPEQKVESWQLSPYLGELSGLPAPGGGALAVICPGGHLSLSGLKVYNGSMKSREKKKKAKSVSFHRGCLVSSEQAWLGRLSEWRIAE